MKQIVSVVLFLCSCFLGMAQEQEPVFKNDEFFKFKVQYLSFTASYATLHVKEETFKDKSVYHVIGKGKSSGFLSLFFKINDRYETFIDKETLSPYRFVRNISEGGYTKDIMIDFDQENQKALVNDRKHKTKNTYEVKEGVQDMMSAFYFLRNQIDPTKLKVGEEETIAMFFDKENYTFKLRFLGNETIRTKFGKVNCLKFRPLVQADRVFKEEESLTIWISNDKNKMPVKISANLAVGSLTANLTEYKGLKYPFVIN